MAYVQCGNPAHLSVDCVSSGTRHAFDTTPQDWSSQVRFVRSETMSQYHELILFLERVRREDDANSQRYSEQQGLGGQIGNT
jgi:hypothetical protein